MDWIEAINIEIIAVRLRRAFIYIFIKCKGWPDMKCWLHLCKDWTTFTWNSGGKYKHYMGDNCFGLWSSDWHIRGTIREFQATDKYCVTYLWPNLSPKISQIPVVKASLVPTLCPYPFSHTNPGWRWYWCTIVLRRPYRNKMIIVLNTLLTNDIAKGKVLWLSNEIVLKSIFALFTLIVHYLFVP